MCEIWVCTNILADQLSSSVAPQMQVFQAALANPCPQQFPNQTLFQSIHSILCGTIVWYSLPLSMGFEGQKTDPGYVYLFVHVDMESSRHDTHDGMKSSLKYFCHSFSISLISQNWLAKEGGFSLVKQRWDRRSSKQPPTYTLQVVRAGKWFFIALPGGEILMASETNNSIH